MRENIKFWRTKNGSHEIDFILENLSSAFEIKYKSIKNKKDERNFAFFIAEYPDIKVQILTKQNFSSFNY